MCLRNVKIGIITSGHVTEFGFLYKTKRKMRKMRKSNFKKKCVGNQIGSNT